MFRVEGRRGPAPHEEDREVQRHAEGRQMGGEKSRRWRRRDRGTNPEGEQGEERG